MNKESMKASFQEFLQEMASKKVIKKVAVGALTAITLGAPIAGTGLVASAQGNTSAPVQQSYESIAPFRIVGSLWRANHSIVFFRNAGDSAWGGQVNRYARLEVLGRHSNGRWRVRILAGNGSNGWGGVTVYFNDAAFRYMDILYVQ